MRDRRGRRRMVLRGYKPTALLRSAVGVVALSIAAACVAAATPSVTKAIGASDDVHAQCTIEFAAVGASFTEMGSPDNDGGKPGTYFDRTLPGNHSWAYWADRDPNLKLTGGYARSGATTWEIAKVPDLRVKPGSYLVIVLGTNNVLRDKRPFADAPADIERIISNAGVDRSHALVSLLPPNNKAPQRIKHYNDVLREWGQRTGVQIISPAEHMHSERDTFKPGMTVDGTHLSLVEARRMGLSIAAHLNAMAGCTLPTFAMLTVADDEPEGAPECGLPDGGCRQAFTTGSAYRSATTDAHLVSQPALDTWQARGGPAGQLGYPTGGAFCIGTGGCFQRFQNGTISWSLTDSVQVLDARTSRYLWGSA